MAIFPLLGLATNSMAAAPKVIAITCRSPATGVVELRMNSPKIYSAEQETIEYELDVTTYDKQSGRSLGTVHYPVDEHSNFVRARLYTEAGPAPLRKEPNVNLKVPAFSTPALWAQYPDTCYVPVPNAGFNLDLGLNTNTVLQDQTQSSMIRYAVNPNIYQVMKPGIGWPSIRDALKERYCPDTVLWEQLPTIECVVTQK